MKTPDQGHDLKNLDSGPGICAGDHDEMGTFLYNHKHYTL